mgnify:FL=1
MKKIIYVVALSGFVFAPSVWAMSTLSDDELADVDGQALFNLSYLAPADAGNFESANNVGFYKLGFEAEIAANLNIKKLQLGCGGINGAGNCDIDIDNFSLSGAGNSATSNTSSTADRAARVQSDAILTNPFFQFAIKNPNTAATREVVGFRIGSEAASGLITFGTENLATPNGINKFSGYMVAASNVSGATQSISTTTSVGAITYNCTNLSLCGVATTQAVNLGGTTDPNHTVLRFDTDPNITLCTSGCYSGNTGTADPYNAASTGVNIPAMNVPFSGGSAVVNGNRVSSTQVLANGSVPTVSLNGGKLFVNMETQICVAFFICVPNATVNMQGSVSGLTAKINFSQSLGYIHKADINSPFSLSVQGQAMRWPGAVAADVAQKGWWMSFNDPVSLMQLYPSSSVNIVPAFNQIATAFYNYFVANPIPISTNAGLDQLFNGSMTVNVGALTVPATLAMNLQDLQLSTQNFTPNCYGGLKFC